MLGIYVRTSMDDRDNSIESQKKEGVKFAKANKMDFEIYADEGKSGYKISDDDKDDDLFKNRPSFSKLLNDIKEKKIDAIWVLNHSRLSRNQYGSAYIFRSLEKQKIKVFMGDTLYDYKNKETKFQRAIMDAFDEYDRERIVVNTTRGLHFKIDKGERSFGKLYGYKKVGTTAKGLQEIAPVQSEIENIKYGYKRILEGATLRQLTLELYNKKSLDKAESMRISLKWHKILKHFSYTGYELNLAGLEAVRKFNNFETDSLSMLNDSKYYTRSANYREKIITIEKWIKVVERLRINRQIRLKHNTNKASTEIATGIIVCGKCGQRYYFYRHGGKKNGKIYYYNYYKHWTQISNINKCGQKKSFIVDNMNEIFKLFFFYFYVVFDNTTELIEEAQRVIKKQQLQLQERIGNLEKNEKKIEKQITKFELAISDDEDNDTKTIKYLAKLISEKGEERNKNRDDLNNAKIELEKLNIQYAGNETTNAFYNVKDKINLFFKKMNKEEQRDELKKVIKECMIFGAYLLIDTGTVLFLFDTAHKYKLKNEMLKNIDKDKIYKDHFIETLTREKRFNDITDLETEALMKKKIYEADEVIIFDCKLNGRNKQFNKEIAEQLFKKYKIKYDYTNHATILFFLEDYL